jgi:hypothetical protein
MKITVLLLVVAVVACNDAAQSDKIAPAPPDTPVLGKEESPAPVEHCYAKVDSKDTVQLRLVMNDNQVTGSLLYKLAEKDSNKGQLQGTMHGDVLIANYTFQSEGTESVREVAFRIKDSTATEGYGKVEEKNGRMVFTDPDNLSFGKSMVLKEIPCGDIAR